MTPTVVPRLPAKGPPSRADENHASRLRSKALKIRRGAKQEEGLQRCLLRGTGDAVEVDASPSPHRPSPSPASQNRRSQSPDERPPPTARAAAAVPSPRSTSRRRRSLPGLRVLLCHVHVVVAAAPAVLLPLYALRIAEEPAWRCAYPNVLLSDIAARNPVYRGALALFWGLHLFSALAVLALAFPEVGKVRLGPRGVRAKHAEPGEVKASKAPEKSQSSASGNRQGSEPGSAARHHGIFGPPPRSFIPCLNFIVSSMVWGSAVGLFGLIGFMYDYDVKATMERERNAAGGPLSDAQQLALLVHKLHVSFAMWFFLWTFVQVLAWWWGVERHLRGLAVEAREHTREEKIKKNGGTADEDGAALLAAITRDAPIRKVCATATVLSIAVATVCAVLSRCASGHFVWGVLVGESGTLISAGCLVGRGLMGVCEKADQQEEMEMLRLEREGR